MSAVDRFDGASAGVKVSLRPAPRGGRCARISSFVREILSKYLSVESWRTAWEIATRKDLSQRFLSVWKPGSYVVDLPNPRGTTYLTAHPSVMSAIFNHYRKSPEGIFYDSENSKLLLAGILQDLFPEEIAELGLEEGEDALVLTAKAAHVPALRRHFDQFIGASVISGYSKILADIADDLLTGLSDEEKKECDVAKLSFEFAATVICRLFTEYGSSREDYQSVGKAMDAVSKRMARIILSQPATPEQVKEYEAAKTFIKDLVQTCLDHPSPFVLGLKTSEMNDFQCKVFLFGLYFAGTETTASVTNALLWELGKQENQWVQDQIRDPETSEKAKLRAVAETFRLHPPVYVAGRCLRENTVLRVEDRATRGLLFEKELRKGHNIVCLPQAGGQDPVLYPHPETFDPLRFDDPQIPNLSFFPFGGGFHICPGRYLAKAELLTFLDRFFYHYSAITLFPKHFEQKGVATLRATTPAKIQLIPLNHAEEE